MLPALSLHDVFQEVDPIFPSFLLYISRSSSWPLTTASFFKPKGLTTPPTHGRQLREVYTGAATAPADTYETICLESDT